MPAALPLKHPVKVGQLVRRRLRELKRTPRELADAVQVSEDYIVDIVAGRRRPPAPGRIDLYAPMARFLRLHRNDLPTCARVERSAEPAARRRPDRKSTRLNSSHLVISYAVFCLKKKKKSPRHTALCTLLPLQARSGAGAMCCRL